MHMVDFYLAEVEGDRPMVDGTKDDIANQC